MAFCCVCVCVCLSFCLNTHSTACQLCSWLCSGQTVVALTAWTRVIRQRSLPHMDATVWKDLQVCFSICDSWFYYHILWEQNYIKHMQHELWMELTLYIEKSLRPFSAFFFKCHFRLLLNLECPRREATMILITFAGQLEPFWLHKHY